MLVNDIEVKVIRKNIKNVHLYVKPPAGDVEVTCPLLYSDENIKLFVRTRINWIRRQKEAFDKQSRQSKREYVSGETMYLFGNQYFLQIDYDSRQYNIKQSGEKIHFVVRKGSTVKQREAVFNAWYRSKLKKVLDSLVVKIEKQTGLNCSSYSITNMQSKWGSCNTETKRINLNLQLVKVPLICIEYVVLHELAHTVEKSHNGKFIAILDQFMPTWREVKELLNSQTINCYGL